MTSTYLNEIYFIICDLHVDQVSTLLWNRVQEKLILNVRHHIYLFLLKAFSLLINIKQQKYSLEKITSTVYKHFKKLRMRVTERLKLTIS